MLIKDCWQTLGIFGLLLGIFSSVCAGKTLAALALFSVPGAWVMEWTDYFFPLHQTWSYISSSCKGSSLVWGMQAINHAFLFRGSNMVHPGYTWCKFKFSFANWNIFQGYIRSTWYLLTKTCQLFTGGLWPRQISTPLGISADLHPWAFPWWLE